MLIIEAWLWRLGGFIVVFSVAVVATGVSDKVDRFISKIGILIRGLKEGSR
jgi:predicted acetyltransferase